MTTGTLTPRDTAATRGTFESVEIVSRSVGMMGGYVGVHISPASAIGGAHCRCRGRFGPPSHRHVGGTSDAVRPDIRAQPSQRRPTRRGTGGTDSRSDPRLEPACGEHDRRDRRHRTPRCPPSCRGRGVRRRRPLSARGTRHRPRRGRGHWIVGRAARSCAGRSDFGSTWTASAKGGWPIGPSAGSAATLQPSSTPTGMSPSARSLG